MAAVEKVQSYANHRRIPPVYFQFAFVVLTGELIYRIIHVVRHPGLVAAWEVVVWFAVLVIAYAARRNAHSISGMDCSVPRIAQSRRDHHQGMSAV